MTSLLPGAGSNARSLTDVFARGLLAAGGEMTHREFLMWLQPRLEKAGNTGLGAEAVREIREVLDRMREGGTLQPFASRLQNLVRTQPTLDPRTIAELASEARSELAPAREKTVVFAAQPERDDD